MLLLEQPEEQEHTLLLCSSAGLQQLMGVGNSHERSQVGQGLHVRQPHLCYRCCTRMESHKNLQEAETKSSCQYATVILLLLLHLPA
jgi:hypothetical protein